MNQHLAKAIEIYEKHELNIQEHILWHMQHGVVLCDDNCFGLYYFSHSDDIESFCSPKDADTLFVTFYTGDMSKALERFVDDFKYVSFSRDFQDSPRNRKYLISKFNQKITR